MPSDNCVALSEAMVLQKSKANSLDAVRTLNLWGCNLSDVSILRRLPKVQVVSISVNKVNSLRDFAYCPALKELYLRKNDIAVLESVVYLRDLVHLKILWLRDNPCAEEPHYREFVIGMLPWLQKLDDQDITSEERANATSLMKTTLAHRVRRAKALLEQETARRDEESASARERHTPPPPTEPAAAPAPAPTRPAAPTAAAAAVALSQVELPDEPRSATSSRSDSATAAPSPRTRTGSNNVLIAVIALLDELPEPALELVRDKCNVLLSKAAREGASHSSNGRFEDSAGTDNHYQSRKK